MELLLPIILLLAGFVLIVLEVFIPSLGILTIGSVACVVAALLLGFGHSAGLGLSLSGAVLVGVPVILVVSFRVFPETPMGRHMMLLRRPSDHPEPATENRPALVGREGVARSSLRPSGVALIDGERVDVLTRGELVEAGSPIVVIENRGNRIVVKAIGHAPSHGKEDER